MIQRYLLLFNVMRVQDILKRQKIVKASELSSLPKTFGVYLFYHFQKQDPVYIGKSIDLRARVRSHFTAAKSVTKEFKITHFCSTIGVIETQGELGALLLESMLVKTFKPLYNRRLKRLRTFVSIELKACSQGYLHPLCVRQATEHYRANHHRYGVFYSQIQAQETLHRLCDTHRLCRKIMGFESGGTHTPCFAYQLGRCFGACVGKLSRGEHNAKLKQALDAIKITMWPYSKPAVLREGSGEGEVLHVIDQWRYVKTIARMSGEVIFNFSSEKSFDKDVYLLLTKYNTSFEVDLKYTM